MSEIKDIWKKNISADRRRLVFETDRFCEIALGDQYYRLQPHDFWKKFVAGWEPDTRRIYDSFVRPGMAVVDIGGWIGPTLLFADAAGAGKILVAEPNPHSYKMIAENIALNPTLQKKVTLINKAVSDRNGPLLLGLDDAEDDTSVCSIQGDDFISEGITLTELLGRTGFDSCDFLKIDTEGAEILMADQLPVLKEMGDPVIHLSLHMPFWPEESDPGPLIDALAYYRLYDDRGDLLTYHALASRLRSRDPFPDWGSKHGNFFELLLLPPSMT